MYHSSFLQKIYKYICIAFTLVKIFVLNNFCLNSLSMLQIFYMYLKREAALASAMTPVSSAPRSNRQIPVRDKYPYVFDSYLEAKQSSSFIAGAKVPSD